MVIPLSWKIGAGVAGLIIAMFAWNGFSQYLEARQADEITRDSAAAAAQESQQARARAQQLHAQRAAKLIQQRADLSNTHEEMKQQARQYQAQRAVRLEKEHQEELRVQASYRLDQNQSCAGGIVINRSGSKFTQVVGKDGTPIKCQGNLAEERLR